VEVSQRIQSPRSEALARGNIGILHVDAGRLQEAKPQLDLAVTLSVGVDTRFEGGFRSARARCVVLAGGDAAEDLRRARLLLTRVNDRSELAKLTAVEAMAWGLQGQVDRAQALLDSLPSGDPLLARRVEEARQFLLGL
jgi:hypothetical protein